MPRGRKPKPTRLHAIEGTARANRANPNEPQVPAALPEPPEHLHGRALREWHRIAPELAALGLLTKLDGAVLAAFCSSLALWRQAEDELRQVGALTVTTAAGNEIQHPLLGISNTAKRDMLRYATEFGLTPSSRSRVSAAPAKEDSMARFFD